MDSAHGARSEEEHPSMIIDVHGHVMAPPELYAYQAMLYASKGHHGKQGARISDERLDVELDSHVKLLEQVGTDLQFLSPRPFTMMHSQEPNLIVQWYIEAANDVIARQVKRRPDMFRGLCGLPQSPNLPAEACVDELVRCIDDLGFVGCILNPDPAEGTGYVPPLGDPYWFPLYERLVELDVPTLIHSAGCHNRRETYSNHFITEESIAILSLIEGRVMERFPTLKLIVAHGGGAVPYQVGRWRAHHWRTYDESFDDALRKFYFDTVLYNHESLDLLCRVVGTDRVVFGTERPGSGSAQDPATGRWYDDTKPLIDSIEWLTDDDRRAIYEDNARSIFTRLKQR